MIYRNKRTGSRWINTPSDQDAITRMYPKKEILTPQQRGASPL